MTEISEGRGDMSAEQMSPSATKHSIDDACQDKTTEKEEWAMIKKDGWKIRLAVFLTEFNALFSFQTLITLLPHLKSKVVEAGHDGNIIMNNMMWINTVLLVITHICNITIGPNRFAEGYNIIRFYLAWLIFNFLVVLVFYDQPYVLLVAAAAAAISSASLEGQLWGLAPIFPQIDDKIRAMISSGNGLAGVISVILQTIIRAIIFSVKDEGESESDTDEDMIMIWTFIMVYLTSLAIALSLMISIPRSKFFKYFEAKYKAENVLSDENETTADDTWGVRQFCHKDLMQACSHPGFIIFHSFFLSYMCFPFLAGAYQGTWTDGESSLPIDNNAGVLLADQGWPFNNVDMHKWWWSPTVLAAFNVLDFIGRNIPLMSEKLQFTVPAARVAGSLRIILAALMVMCVSPEVQVFESSLLFLILLCILATTNGWVVTSCMMIGSDYLPDSYAGRASAVLVTYLFGGIFSGFFTSMPFQNMVVENGVAALIFVLVFFGIFPWLPRIFCPVTKEMQETRVQKIALRTSSTVVKHPSSNGGGSEANCHDEEAFRAPVSPRVDDQ